MASGDLLTTPARPEKLRRKLQVAAPLLLKHMGQYVRHIETYGHNGRIGVLVEFRLETEFSAKALPFTQLAKDVALHIAAVQPVSLADLLQQPFVKDSARTIGQLLAALSTMQRERIDIARFMRWDTEVPDHALSEPPKAPANAMRFGGSEKS